MSLPKQLVTALPYFANSAELFSIIAEKPWSVFLDSGYPYSNQGRYDILASDPVCTLLTHGDVTEITQNGQSIQSTANPFDLVKQYLLPTCLENNVDLPFNGGAIGYFSYDLARRLEKLPTIAEDAEHIAEMAVGIYAWALIVDHHQQKTYLVGQAIDSQAWQSLIDQFSFVSPQPAADDFNVIGDIVCNMDKSAYSYAYNRIKAYLKEGDCYQVNLSQRFVAPCQGNPWTAYQRLRAINSAPFSCYLNLPEVQILSSSPECFLKVSQGMVETKPIKGTRSRKQDSVDDARQINGLIHSSKDQAENVMIVDLLRNDISKTCKKGSVQVPKLFAVESYATVHHLVSTVTGVLAEGQQAVDLLKSCFPGGSVTGAPKIRAMEVIEELEPNRRGIYCGTIGYIGFNGNMDSNIAIRTLVHSDGTIRFWAGGGIVNDSVLEEEYQECFDKAAAMLDLLRQLTAKQ
ncbi:aminodeoxychorismate synthase component I [Crenothrix sp.]|uniref:aminodeoxychorismate synthase component I n=1 Tax=Crenothrix sp. TaxID=3100433 RepID=UPI00374D71B6